jgi:uncharacterized protein (DUF2336 family)
MSTAQVCLQDLELLSNERDGAKRHELLRKITDLFFMTEKQQTSADRNVFGNVMVRIAADLEVQARAELAHRLAPASFAPLNVVRRLADDEIEVARPVLEKSILLTDDDLVKIASSKGQDHLMAITRRETLSTVVTDVIVQRGNDDVLVSVAGNRGANFSNGGYETLAGKATSLAGLRAQLMDRDDVPTHIVDSIKAKVADKLKSEFSAMYPGVSAQDVSSAVDAGSGKMDFTPLEDADNYETYRAMVQQLHQKGLLREALLREFAEKGRHVELVHGIALLTSIDPKMAYHTLYEAEVPALGVLCKAFHFRKETFAALLQERVRHSNLSADHVVSALKRYESLTDETAQRILRFLKVRLSVSAD